MMGLHHIALGARDPAHLASFYTDVFELPVTARHHDDEGRLRSVWLDVGEFVLMIERTDRTRPQVDGVDAGLFLLAFGVTAAERSELEERLVRAGAPIEDRTEHTSYARDPEGNRVAISHYPLESSDSTVSAYGRIAHEYAGAEPAEDDPAWRRACRQLFAANAPGRRVLEIGCGPGMDAAALHDAGFDVTASDGAEEFVEIVRERFDHLTTIQLDFTRLPEDLGSFDAIYGHSCFIHVPRVSAVRVLAGLRGALRDGGLLFLSLAEAEPLSHVVPNWGGEEGNDVEFHYHRPDEVAAFLLEAGFRDVEIHRLGWSDDSPYYCGPPAERIERLAIRPYQALAFR